MTGSEASSILLHICCAPCGGGCVFRLETEENIQPVLYYSNSNICSKEEFDRRLESVKKLAEAYHLKLLVDPYDHEAWLQAVEGLENEPEYGKRCEKCFAWNLARAAEKAAELGLSFSTTLTVSPRKSSAKVFAAGGQFPHFEKRDFKKKEGYSHACRIARELGFYRQNFCGCEFSKAGKSADLPADRQTGK